MAALTINGISIPVVESSRQPVTLGGEERAESGKVRNFDRATFYEYRYKTGPLTQSDSALVQALIRGDGQVLSFDSTFAAQSFMWTTRGRAPASASEGGVLRLTFGQKYGAACASFSANTVRAWVLNYPYNTGTLMGWCQPSGVAEMHHFIFVTGTGKLYTDGVEEPPTTEWLFGYIQGGDLLLGDIDGQGVSILYDDIVALPYDLPPSWVSSVYALHSARAWPSLPYVLAEGERIPTGGMKMKGTVDTIEHPDSAFTINGSPVDVLNFTLKQTP